MQIESSWHHAISRCHQRIRAMASTLPPEGIPNTFEPSPAIALNGTDSRLISGAGFSGQEPIKGDPEK
jgi:hypothetical protein